VSLRGLVLFLYLAGTLPVCFFRPFYGIVVWTVLAFANPHQMVWGIAATIPWSNYVAILTIAGLLIFQRNWLQRFASFHVLLIALLWLWFVFTSIASVNTPSLAHHADETLFRLNFVSKVLVMAVLTIAIVDGFRQLRILVLTIAGSFAFFVIKSVPFIILSGGSHRIFGPQFSMIADNNDFGLAINMTVPLFFCLAQTEQAKRWRRFWMLIFVVSIPVVFFTYSRGALVGLAVVLFLMILQVRQRFLIVPVLALAAMIAVVFAPAKWKERMDPTANQIDASALSRFNAWTFSWRLAVDYPLAGGGFETFSPELFMQYAPTVTDVHGPHNICFGVVAEHGFPGLALYLGLVGYSFIKTITIARRARQHALDDIASYATMFRLSMIGFLTSGMFLGRAYFDYYFTIVAAIVVLDRIVIERIASEDDGNVENVNDEVAYVPAWSVSNGGAQ
jgi:probable O-glycosylation ligase (exosortase A-associated)